MGPVQIAEPLNSIFTVSQAVKAERTAAARALITTLALARRAIMVSHMVNIYAPPSTVLASAEIAVIKPDADAIPVAVRFRNDRATG